MLSHKQFLFCLALLVPVSDAVRIRPTTLVGSRQLQSTFGIEPNLLFTKVIRSRVFAIGWEFTVDYQIFNIGGTPATNVLVKDPDFVEDRGMFLVVKPDSAEEPRANVKGQKVVSLSSGDFTVKTLSPGANVSYSLTAVVMASSFPPEEGGRYRFAPAKITYAKGDTMQVGWSSLSHENVVEFLTKVQADRRYAPKSESLTVFVLLVLCTVLIPFVLWKIHTVKYDGLQELVDQAKEERKQIRRANKMH